jgi:hypothetical protein
MPLAATRGLTVELLERRRLMDATAIVTDGVLTITGTRRRDEIVVELDSNNATQLIVTANGQSGNFNVDLVSSIRINARGGNDVVTVSEVNGRIFCPVTVDAGTGNDTITTGSGDDVILGGEGRDFISAGAGDDQITGGNGKDDLSGGDDNDVLLGGNGKDNLRAGAGDDNVDGGLSRDTLDLGEGDDAVAIDKSHRSERTQYDPTLAREYRVAKLRNIDQDLRGLVEQVIPGSKVSRVEVDGTTVTLMYKFGTDPKSYKLVLDISAEEVELVTREISVDELRDPARDAFTLLFPDAFIRSAFHAAENGVDIRYSDAEGAMHEVNVHGLVWTLDDADGDANNDGWHDSISVGDNGMPDGNLLETMIEYKT